MTKDFDCVDMKHQAGQKIQKKLTSLTKKEEVKFWRSRSERLRSRKEQEVRISKNSIP